jgi:hypothetical protein
MGSWPRFVIRTFAVLNMCFGLSGLLVLVVYQYVPLEVMNPWDQHPPYFVKAYYFQVAINLVFVLTAIWSAFPLWRLRQLGKTICNILFCGEIGYFWVGASAFAISALLNIKPSVVSEFILGSAGPGNTGIGLQLVCGYPLIALVGINIGYRRLKSI